MISITSAEYDLLRTHLRNLCGIDIPPEKSYLFETRLNGFLEEEKFSNFSELIAAIPAPEKEKTRTRLIELMTTNETFFFRDIHPFESIRKIILSEIIDRKNIDDEVFKNQIKIWSIGCSTGQEPYSIAMVVHEWLQEMKAKQEGIAIHIQLLASDISDEILRRARLGVYSANEISRGLPKDYIERYTIKKNTSKDEREIVQEIKQYIRFDNINLSQFDENKNANYDIVFCRNVLIYFTEELKKKILQKISRILSPNGYLIIGASENLFGLCERFVAVNYGSTIVYRLK